MIADRDIFLMGFEEHYNILWWGYWKKSQVLSKRYWKRMNRG